VFGVAWVRRELGTLGVPPLKRFGQHFLIDPQIRRRLIEIASLTHDDTVLEIGPGLGFLTSMIASEAGRVIAIEKDRTLAPYLRRKFANNANVTIVQGDALKMSIPDNAKIVSSPPYNISSKLTLLILNSHFSLAALLLQIEFAERLTAPSGSRNYGRLTVMFQTRARARMIEIVPRTAFYPQPKVDSSLLTITPTRELTPNNKELFEEMIRVVFTQRRRRLPTVLARFLKSKFPNQQDEIYTRIRIPEKRVFETTVKEFVTISDAVATFLTGSKGKDIDCMLE